MLLSWIYQKLLIFYLMISYGQIGYNSVSVTTFLLFIFIPRASKTIHKHWKCLQYVLISTFRCPTRVYSKSTALQNFYEWPISFHKRHRIPKFCQLQRNCGLLIKDWWLNSELLQASNWQRRNQLAKLHCTTRHQGI